jgi:hypothetical protein
MAPTIVWFCPNIPLVQGDNPTTGNFLLEDGSDFLLEDGTNFSLEGPFDNPISVFDECQLLLGCSLNIGFGFNVDYFRRYLNDKGVAS